MKFILALQIPANGCLNATPGSREEYPGLLVGEEPQAAGSTLRLTVAMDAPNGDSFRKALPNALIALVDEMKAIGAPLEMLKQAGVLVVSGAKMVQLKSRNGKNFPVGPSLIDDSAAIFFAGQQVTEGSSAVPEHEAEESWR